MKWRRHRKFGSYAQNYGKLFRGQISADNEPKGRKRGRVFLGGQTALMSYLKLDPWSMFKEEMSAVKVVVPISYLKIDKRSTFR